MIYVLPISDISNSLLGQSILFAKEHGLDYSGLTLEKCHEVVVSFAACLLSEQLNWIPYERELQNAKGLVELLERVDVIPVYAKDYLTQQPTTATGDFVNKILYPEIEMARATARLFQWYQAVKEDSVDTKRTAEQKRSDELTDLYDEEIISDVWNALGKVMDNFLPEGKTWDIWYMRNLGRDVYLHKAGDWRVEDWKRLRGQAGVQDG